MSTLSDRPFAPTTTAGRVLGLPPLNSQPSAVMGPLPAVLILTGTAEAVVLDPTLSTLPLMVQVPPDKTIECKPLKLYASGTVETESSSNLTIKAYAGSSTTVGSDTLLGSSGTIATNTTTADWWLDGTFIYSDESGKLTGEIGFFINGSRVATVAFSNSPTGISNENNPVVSFLLSVTSSGAAGETPTTFTVRYFSAG